MTCLLVFSGGGSFIALIPVLLANWLGVSRLPQALGRKSTRTPPVSCDTKALCDRLRVSAVCYTFQATTLLMGPPIVGWLYDAMGSYKFAFVLVGLVEFVSAGAMLYVPKLVQQHEEQEAKEKQEERLAQQQARPLQAGGSIPAEGGNVDRLLPAAAVASRQP